MGVIRLRIAPKFYERFRMMMAAQPNTIATAFLRVSRSRNRRQEATVRRRQSPPLTQGYRIAPFTLSERKVKSRLPPKLPAADTVESRSNLAK